MAGNVRLRGDGRQTPAPIVVRTETLRYDVPDAIVTTPDDVRVTFGAHTLSARGLKANLNERTLHLDQKVNGRFQR
jgi:LPS export ABC transporter protein LptC